MFCVFRLCWLPSMNFTLNLLKSVLQLAVPLTFFFFQVLTLILPPWLLCAAILGDKSINIHTSRYYYLFISLLCIHYIFLSFKDLFQNSGPVYEPFALQSMRLFYDILFHYLLIKCILMKCEFTMSKIFHMIPHSWLCILHVHIRSNIYDYYIFYFIFLYSGV